MPQLKKKQSKIDFIQAIYDYNNKKFGTMLFEKKFIQMIYGLYFHMSTCARLKLFARLSGLMLKEITETMN